MQFLLQPCHMVLAARVGWANERQQQIIEFQNDQIQALLKLLGKKRVLLTDDQRRGLAVKGHSIGRKALLELTTIVTPDTILRCGLPEKIRAGATIESREHWPTSATTLLTPRWPTY